MERDDIALQIDRELREDIVDNENISCLQAIWESDKSQIENMYQYAMGLSKSNIMENHMKAISLFHQLSKSQSYFQEALYGLSRTYYIMQNYASSLDCAEELLRQNPDNNKYQNIHLAALLKYNKQKKFEETVNTVGLVAGVGAVAAAAAAIFLLRKRK